MLKDHNWQYEFVTPPAQQESFEKSSFSLNSLISFCPTKMTLNFSINAFAAIVNSSAFWKISQPLDFLITFCQTNDFGLPPILSTIPFPLEVAKYLQVNAVLHLMEKTIFIRCTVYLFLNLEERLLLHITAEEMPSLGGMCWSYKWNKKAAIVSLFFCFESKQIKSVLQVPSHKCWQQLLQIHNADCIYFILVLMRVVHCKINL